MKMKIKISTTEVFKAILLFILVYDLPHPWWKWVLFIFTLIGITLER